MKIEPNTYLDFKDVLIKPKRSTIGSRSEVDIVKNITFLHSRRTWEGVPILASNMDTVGTFEMYRALSKHRMLTVFHKFYSVEDYQGMKDELDPNYYSISTGIGEGDWTKCQTLIALLNPHFITIDVANGYCSRFVDFCLQVRERYPQITIIAGNVATGDMVQELLITARVDVVKCGIGSGSVCSTRLKTGVGVPQLSVCLECAEVANGLGGHIISDGGCTLPSDVCKAFGGGAHMVMLGGALAGHEQSGGEVIEEEGGKRYLMFYGMSSEYCQKKHYGGMDKSYKSSEGKVRKIPYRGDVNETISDIKGGLNSCLTYVGARRLKDLAKCCTFIRVNNQVNTIFDGGRYQL